MNLLTSSAHIRNHKFCRFGKRSDQERQLGTGSDEVPPYFAGSLNRFLWFQ